MTKKVITLNLVEGSTPADCIVQRENKLTGVREASQRVLYVNASSPGDLASIRKGTNPRDYDPNSSIVKKIKEKITKREGFCVFNGGLQVTIDAGSFIYDEEKGTVSFTCDNVDSGNYDGQHSRNAALDSIDEIRFPNQPMLVTLLEDSFWKSPEEQRSAAAAWNKRKAQELASEQNQRGEFDTLKKKLQPRHANTIRWKENQRYSKSNKVIPIQKGIVTVSTLLAQAIPPQSDWEFTEDTARRFPRVSKKSTERLWAKGQNVMAPIIPHASTILDLADYIQESWKSIEGWEKYRVLRKHSKRNFEDKTAEECPLYVYHNFSSEEKVEGAINMEFLYVIMQGLLKSTMSFDRETKEQYFEISIDEVKDLWDSVKEDVLIECEEGFAREFPKSHRMVQVLDNSTIWSIVEKTIAAKLCWDQRKTA